MRALAEPQPRRRRAGRLRRLAASGAAADAASSSEGGSATATASAGGATTSWAQLLAQQLLLCLWRLHTCAILPLPATVPPGPAGEPHHPPAARPAADEERRVGGSFPQRVVPQGALGGGSATKLPFLAVLIGAGDSAEATGGVRKLGLRTSKTSPGYI